MTELLVPRRFCGPPSSGNGGWTAGALAALTTGGPTVSVSLRRPPPLDTSMLVLTDGDVTTVSVDGETVALAEPTDIEPTVVDPVSPEEAAAAEAAFPGLRSHPFPSCFVCGPERAAGDGLRIFPGPVEVDGETRYAATWTPDASLTDELFPATWAALDCIGGWAGDLAERPMVLARMTARLDTLPVVGEPHVVVAVARGQEGRKTFTTSTLYDADGRVVGCAEHLWVAIAAGEFGAV